MDREYLEDYTQREKTEFEEFWKGIKEGRFSFGENRYPPDERFVKLKNPVAVASRFSGMGGNFWSLVPFSGSLILYLPANSRFAYETHIFDVSEIPGIIDFIKETGRLQVVFTMPIMEYEGLDFLDPFFEELTPPAYYRLPMSALGTDKEIETAIATFKTIADIRYSDYIIQITQAYGSNASSIVLNENLFTYEILKLGRYPVVEEIENLMTDDPQRAFVLFRIYRTIIVGPFVDLRTRLRNVSMREVKLSSLLPTVYQPSEIPFPYEIGKFLVKKLTYAPQGLRACNELIDHYDAYDLQKVAESLNDAIVQNQPDKISEWADDVSEILENAWNDPLIPRQTKNIIKGIPVSIAAMGTAASAFTGGLEGFLAGLGFSVGAKFLEAEFEGLSEKVGRFFARSYQANVYDFKKKYDKQIRK